MAFYGMRALKPIVLFAISPTAAQTPHLFRIGFMFKVPQHGKNSLGDPQHPENKVFSD